MIDFYIEHESPIKNKVYKISDVKKTHSLTIDSILKRFEPCFTLNKKVNDNYYRSDDCVYPNVRFHLIDIRSMISNKH